MITYWKMEQRLSWLSKKDTMKSMTSLRLIKQCSNVLLLVDLLEKEMITGK